MIIHNRKGLIFIISGPAGSGKTTLCQQLETMFCTRLKRVITATSRPPRDGEENGKDYHFLPKDAFQTAIAEGAFYEFAEVHGRYYGVLKKAIIEPLQQNHDLLLNIDVQGAATFRKAAQQDRRLEGRLVSLFVLPQSLAQIRERLQQRGQDDEAEIEKRLHTAASEIRQWREFDYCLISDTREHDFSLAKSIYEAETMSAARYTEMPAAIENYSL